MDRETLIRELFRVEAIKFGEFVLKSGQTSSVYVDLRTALTFPDLLHSMSSMLLEITPITHDFIVGVPYTAWPLATCLSLLSKKPMLLRRKEVKSYGTQTGLHGNYKAGQCCLVIEDVVTTGSSVLETIQDLESCGLIVHDVICFLDRQQGASEYLSSKGYRLHSAMTLEEVLNAHQ